ncbi:MAG TPA: alpha/beta fold hydrolase, partial [Rubrobacteraceae bacterium]|nr:alpha/beta fold hydrolase [Rubrobacteraceae bacterium]
MRLSYTISGDRRRPAVLFLHGFMGSSGDWGGITAVLEERYFCVAVDLPGHGTSVGLPLESYTFEVAARMVLAVLGELGIERTTLVGYSMGGRLALYTALRIPQRVSRLVLVGASPGIAD